MPRTAKVTRVAKATQDKIIKAACRAFARNGYEGASIRAIVAEADVNQAAINYHFGSKEGLYRAVLQVALRALMKDDELSITAKNIKVITANGHVTLRGPVRTAQEKAKIGQLAKSAAGGAQIDDQLEVTNK